MHDLTKQLVLICVFLFVTPVAISFSIFSLSFYSINISSGNQTYDEPSSNLGAHVYASLPESVPSVSAEVNSQDARVEIIRQYLEKYNSPLLGHEDVIVAASDQYGLDFRLITAISQQESNLCKIIPPESHNCWGWGIHSEGSLGFRSYTEAIYTVSAGLKHNYIDEGYTTPDIIMTKYTPQSNGSWARGVNMFMEEML